MECEYGGGGNRKLRNWTNVFFVEPSISQLDLTANREIFVQKLQLSVRAFYSSLGLTGYQEETNLDRGVVVCAFCRIETKVGKKAK